MQLSQAITERDGLANAQQESSQKLTKAARENELLQKQLNDLGRQVQSLLRDLARRDDPTIPPDEEIEAIVKPADNIEEVITNNLVLFRSLSDLQSQNQRLLKIVRELGSKMEAEEKDYKEQLEKEQGEAVLEAHQAIQELEQRLENQRKSSEATIQAYMKERETLRSMVARAERAGVVGVSTAALTNGHVEEMQVSSVGAGDEVLRDLAETRSQFETFKNEMGIDTLRLREEATSARREANELAAGLAKANAKIEYVTGMWPFL
jgi:nucleoprotein TPR